MATVQTTDGVEIDLVRGANGWPYVNGERVGGVTVPSDESAELQIGLVVGNEIFTLTYADYHWTLRRQDDQIHQVGAASSAQTPSSILLYIEDYVLNCRLMEHILVQRPNIHLSIAMTGTEGLATATIVRPDLIVLDLDLPDMSGEEVLAQLKAHPSTAQIPVIIFSADPRTERMTTLVQAGAYGHTPKPILNIGALLALIDRVLREAVQQNQARP